MCYANSLTALYPELAQELDVEKSGITADKILPGSRLKVWWKCKLNPSHIWYARVKDRAKAGSKCPECSAQLNGISRLEIKLSCELSKFLKVDLEQKIIRIDKENFFVDIIVPSEKLVVEYDGSYWHRDKKERDIYKTEQLEKAGWTVIRVREEPLEFINANCIAIPNNNADIVFITGKILAKISELKPELIELEKIATYVENNVALASEEAEALIERKLAKKKKKHDTV